MSLELKTTLMKLEEERRAAWFNKDEESLLNLLADDFREVNIFGRLDKDFIFKICSNSWNYWNLICTTSS